MSSAPSLRHAMTDRPQADDVLVRMLIADELDRIRVVLEDMGVELCCDPEIVRSHLGALQAIDELCQRNENLARTLRADDMIAEARTITLESLRLRLQSGLPQAGRPAASNDGGPARTISGC